MSHTTLQIISLVGAALILVPFAALQFGKLHQEGIPYTLSNLLGSSILLYVAIVDNQYGFILLEAVWALVSIRGLLKGVRVKFSSP